MNIRKTTELYPLNKWIKNGIKMYKIKQNEKTAPNYN